MSGTLTRTWRYSHSGHCEPRGFDSSRASTGLPPLRHFSRGPSDNESGCFPWFGSRDDGYMKGRIHQIQAEHDPYTKTQSDYQKKTASFSSRPHQHQSTPSKQVQAYHNIHIRHNGLRTVTTKTLWRRIWLRRPTNGTTCGRWRWRLLSTSSETHG